MTLCPICNSRNGKSYCLIHEDSICTLCCGSSRTWEKCPTTCKHFKKEKGPLSRFSIYEMSLKNESTGEIIRAVENCFLPNIYQFISCNVLNLNLEFLNSHTLKIEIEIVLDSEKSVPEEIYLKDDWKIDKNWGPFTHLKDFFPLLFIFAGSDSKFSPFNTSVTMDSFPIDFHESHVHWNVAMPFSTLKIREKPLFEDGKKQLEEIQILQGKAFSGNNSTIFCKWELNRPIKIKTILKYQNLQIDQESKAFKFPVSFLIPFKNVIFDNIEFTLPTNFEVIEPQLTLLNPKNSIVHQRYLITPKIKEKIEFGSLEEITFSSKLNIDTYKIIKFDFNLISKAEEEALSFITSYPIPSSVYDGINKLYSEKFAPAKIMLFNFTDSTKTFTIMSEIRGISNKVEKDVMVGPSNEKVVKIIPRLDPNIIKTLFNPFETDISVKVSSDGKNVLNVEEPITILAKDTIIWEVDDPGRSWSIDLGDLIVSWITPHVPQVDEILSKAAKKNGSIGAFDNDTSMEQEIKAIYETISSDIRYVNRAFSFGSEENLLTQRVLTPTQTINGSSGNCIDLSVLIASCLESCGIDPIIILLPTHAIVGWKTNSESQFLEATFLGRYSFEEAKRSGNGTYAEYFPGENRPPGTRIVDVKAIRKKKIYPPPWFD